MSDQIFWYATRAAAILAWFAACLSVAVGVLMSSRFLGRRPTLPWLTDLHRFFAGMALVFVGLHMVTLWADDFISFSWRELLIPWEAQIRGVSRLALAMGVVSAWVMAVVQLTSLVKRQLPSRFWHGVHLGSYGVVVLATVHGWMVGSDASNPVLFSLSASMLAAVGFVTVVRVLRLLDDRKRRYDLALTGAPDPTAVRVPVAAGGRWRGGAGAPDPTRPIPPDPPDPVLIDPHRPVPPTPPDPASIDPTRPVPPPPPDPSTVDPDRPVPPTPPDPASIDPTRPVPPPPPPNVALAAWPPSPPATEAADDGARRPPAPSRPPPLTAGAQLFTDSAAGDAPDQELAAASDFSPPAPPATG